MLTFVSFSAMPEENGMVKQAFSSVAAKRTQERVEYHLYEKAGEVKRYLAQEPLVDFLNYDFEPQAARALLSQIRSRYASAFLVLTADPATSPLEYLKPGLSPNGLILRPVTPQQLMDVWTEAVEMYQERIRRGTSQEGFRLEGREGSRLIPYEQIFYFEAREKKVFLRVRGEEYPCYDTLEGLQDQVPDEFLRCHRGYLVNMAKVRRAQYTENLLWLPDEICIPMSRGGKRLVKEYYERQG